MTRRWARVEGGEYEISNDGLVYSFRKKRLLKTFLNGPNGYVFLSLIIDGVKKPRYVHHLVAKTFIGPRPEGMSINHKNGDKGDNRDTNLEYCSHKDNMKHARETGLTVFGERKHTARLTQQAVVEIRNKHQSGHSYADLGREYSVSSSAIRSVVLRQTWREVL